METTRTLAVASALLAIIGGPAAVAVADTTPCGGVILDGPHRSWNLATTGKPIPFGINSSVVPPGGGLTRSEIEDAMLRGTQEWNRVTPGLVTAFVDNANCPRGFVDDGRNCISFEDPQNLLGGSTLAATVVGWYNSSTHSCLTLDLGTLTFNDYRDTDVVFNDGLLWTLSSAPGSDACKSPCSAFPPRKAQYDVGGVAVHEVGHGLGLDHGGNRADTMYASLGPCDCSKQSLTSCDVEAGANLCYVASTCVPSESPREISCSDGLDNDCDGRIDAADPDCQPATCLAVGSECMGDQECCSGRCRGKPGSAVCK